MKAWLAGALTVTLASSALQELAGMGLFLLVRAVLGFFFVSLWTLGGIILILTVSILLMITSVALALFILLPLVLGTKVLSDEIVIEISAEPGGSFLDQALISGSSE